MSQNSQALVTIDVPTIRPPGVTKRQWRLAALLPRAETAYQAMIEAGYAPATARKQSGRQSGLVGVKRASDELSRLQADTARSLDALSNRALALGAEKLSELDTRDLLSFGLNGKKTAAEIGENVVQSGDGDAWKSRLRRACRLMAHLTEMRLRAQSPPTSSSPSE